jgi:hypothetical protein
MKRPYRAPELVELVDADRWRGASLLLFGRVLSREELISELARWALL